MTTTSYGSWASVTQTEGITLEAGVSEALGDFADDYDIEAVCAGYRAAINEGLPAGVVLAGNEFYGPAYPQDQDWDGELAIKAIVEDVGFWEIAARYDRTANEPQREQQ